MIFWLSSGINRNIVECKAGNLEMTYKLIDVLIET